MRILGGAWAGTALVSPGGRVRPTEESVRDAWIASLTRDLAGAKVLDLFAGTGALGLEALSRGATSVDFVENGRAALHALKANMARVQAKNRSRLFKKDAFTFLQGVELGAYDIVLADPPYTSRFAERLVELWLERPFGQILCVEHAADRILPGRGKRRRLGDTAITTYRARRVRATSPRHDR
jgi:16S rRNA (guanine966-N2)-methyltransferase